MTMMTHPSKRIVDIKNNLTKKILTRYTRFHHTDGYYFSIVPSSISLSSSSSLPPQLSSVQTIPVDHQKVLSFRSYLSMSSLLSKEKETIQTQTNTQIGKRTIITTTTKDDSANVDDNDTHDDSNNKQINNEMRETILYERNGNQYNIMPRSALFVSLFNTIYWSWYVLDFIPAVNNASSSIEMIHVNPTIGYVGIGLGVIMNSITLLYPTLLISKITVVSSSSSSSSSSTTTNTNTDTKSTSSSSSTTRTTTLSNTTTKKNKMKKDDDDDDTTNNNDTTKLVRVYMHSLPLIRPCTTPSLECPTTTTNNSATEFLALDISSKDAKQIINEYNGDISLFRGHLGLTTSTGKYLPYLLSIQDSTEVHHSTLLFQLLTMNRTTTTTTTTTSSSSSSLHQQQKEAKRIQKIQEKDSNKKNVRISPSSSRNKKKRK